MHMDKHHSIHRKNKSGCSLPTINKSNHDLDTPLSFQYNLFLKLQFKKENIKNSINLSFYLARISAPVLLIVMLVPIKVLVNRKTSKIPHTIKNCFQRKRVLLSDRKVVHLFMQIFSLRMILVLFEIRLFIFH